MATGQESGPVVGDADVDEELAAKWRSRAILDAPIAFRAMMRAVEESPEGASAQPDVACAAAILGGLVSGTSQSILPALAQVMETANHDDWWRDSFRTVTYGYMNAYGAAFMESFGSEAEKFAADARSIEDLLAEGLIADEARWRGALAAVWLTTPGLGPSSRSALGSATSGSSFVVYQYCISLGIVSFKRYSGVKVIPPGGSRVLPGLPYTLVSLIFGWWGIPWGPIWTLETIGRNLGGGIDVPA
jgi:hypothetical protein